jgi:chromosomal replication initiator protein
MTVAQEKRGRTLLNPDHTFERFIKGDGNQLACSACQAVAEAPGASYNPLFIYGKVGLGKTHLLQAIGNAHYQRWPDSTVIYVTSERFAIDLVTSIRQRRNDQFRRTYRTADVLLIDDIQFLKNKEGTQEELFHTFNELHERGKQICFSSDRPPEEFSQMEERLVSRFRWGMVADMQPPNFETRLAILKTKAQENGFDVPDEMLELIAKRISSSVRALEGGLTRAIAYADLQGEALNPGLLEQIIPQDTVGDESLTISMIKARVADHCGVSVDDIEGECREKHIARARHIAIYLSRELTKSSFPKIGSAFGGRDHSTVMYACRKVGQLVETPLLRGEIDGIKRELQALGTT